MTSGTRKAEALLAALALLLAAAPAHAIGLDAVMSLLAQRTSGEARYTEERHVSGFDSPLLSSGTLSFSAPDRLARHVIEPRPESMEVQGNTIVLQRGQRTRQLTLDASPELAALIEAMRATLNGDAATLKRHFRVSASGDAAKWVLQLTPLETRLASQVPAIEIVGQASDIRSVELRLAGGDRSLMLIEPLSESPRAPR